MSHYHERKEKNCLDCSADIHGRYCHVCGQENIVPKETVMGLITHFFYDITHFDGKFFSTVRYILLKPGYLSGEYLRGRRTRYLHPIRMYVFTSAFFFIIFFSMYHIENSTNSVVTLGRDASSENFNRTRAKLLKNATSTDDSIQIERALKALAKSSIVIDRDAVKNGESKPVINVGSARFNTKTAYDSAQKLLPKNKRDGWFKRTMIEKKIDVKQKIDKDPEGIFHSWLTKLMHMFPQLLFVSLPIFALSLQVLYLRHKRYYYADHSIFTLHLYIFTFVSLLIYFLFSKLAEVTGWSWLNIISLLTGFYMLWYTYKAMRNFYGQGRVKTFVKYILLSFMSFIVIIFLFLVFFMLSIFES